MNEHEPPSAPGSATSTGGAGGGGLLARMSGRMTGQAAANFGMQLLSTALGFVASVILGRLLGADGLGVYAFSFAVANVLGVVGRLGLENLIVREVSIGRERGDWGTIRGLVRFAEPVSVLTSVVLGCLAALAAWAWSDPSTTASMWPAILLMVGTNGLLLRASALRGVQRIIASQFISLVVRPVLFVASLGALFVVGMDAPWAAVAVHGAAFVLAWALAVAVWTHGRPAAGRVQPSYRVRPWMAAALPLLVIGGLNVFTQQTGTLMVKWLAGNSSAGIYSVAAQLAAFASMVLSVVNIVLAPRFAALHVRGERAEMQRLVSNGVAAITFSTVPMVIALLVAGTSILGLYGSEFVAGYPCLVVLAMAQLFNALSGSVGNLMVMTGHEREVGVVIFFTAVVHVLLNLLLIPHLDMLGAAIGSAVSVVLWNLILVFRVRALLDIDSTVIGWFRVRWRVRP